MFGAKDRKLGFGFMRLPMNGNEVDYDLTCRMVDYFMENGFCYFDTAKVYLDGKSEIAINKCLSSRYPRERYLLTNKLSTTTFDSKEEIRPVFEEQLKTCGVDYFDFYLMHSQNKMLYDKYKKCEAYETALELKKEGKFKHFGISFHDTPEMLEKILTEYPQIEVVQIQFNYADYESPLVQSKRCYEVCRKFNKPVIVMEPVKGGSLVNLPHQAKNVLEELQSGSTASFAIRFAAGFEEIKMVLSGMGSMEMMEDNVKSLKNFSPLNHQEQEAMKKVCTILDSSNLIACTSCRYCTEGCPKKILIPDLFACINNKNIWKNWSGGYFYNIHTQNNGKAKDCIGCGKCEQICPQQLPIRQLLQDVSKEFDKI